MQGNLGIANQLVYFKSESHQNVGLLITPDCLYDGQFGQLLWNGRCADLHFSEHLKDFHPCQLIN